MRHIVIGTVLACLSASAFGQVPPPPPTSAPTAPSPLGTHEMSIVARGCVRGSTLERSGTMEFDPVYRSVNASTFVLRGPRELLEQIRREHQGHYDEIGGVATLPREVTPEDGVVSTKKLGKGTVTLGGRRESTTRPPDAPRQITLKVESFTHIDRTCTRR
jgi:hypothetical protein